MANQYEPLTAKESVQLWEGSGFDSSFIGFAARNKLDTEGSATVPNNILALGTPWYKSVNPAYGDVTETASISRTAGSPLAVALDVEPMYAPVRTFEEGGEITYEERLDEPVWSVLYRDLNYINRVYNVQFEEIDLQFAQITLEEIVAHLANLLRGMDASQITPNSHNKGLKAKNLLYMLGFTGIGNDRQGEFGSGFRELITFVNREIIGVLNSKWWCWKFIPGTFRRAALYSKIYKDSDDETNYSTLYFFRPKKFYNPAIQDVDSTFTLQRTDWYMISLWDYARKIASALEFLVENEDFINIQTVMQGVMDKERKLADGVEIERGVLEYYAYFGRPTMITYSAGMLLAIHNATVCGDAIEISNVEERVGSGDEENRLMQTVSFTPIANQQYKAFRAWLRHPQPYDMPGFWTPDDWQQMIAVSQFKIMGFPEMGEGDYQLTPKVLGTEIITTTRIYFWDQSAAGRPGTVSGYDIGPCQLVTATDIPGFLKRLNLMTQCAFFPLVPLGYTSGDATDTEFVVTGFATDTQHVSWCEFRALEPIKRQFFYNYMGYPTLVDSGEGDFMGIKAAAEALAKSISADETETSADATEITKQSSSTRPSRKDRAKKKAAGDEAED